MPKQPNSERTDVTYRDRLTGMRKREHWPNEAQATIRSEALSKTAAFAEDVQLVAAPVHREEEGKGNA